MASRAERIEGTFDAVRCEKVWPGHVLVSRGMEEIVYVGPIAGAPKEPDGVTLFLSPADFDQLQQMIKRRQN